jgi:hypothetical protein
VAQPYWRRIQRSAVHLHGNKSDVLVRRRGPDLFLKIVGMPVDEILQGIASRPAAHPAHST